MVDSWLIQAHTLPVAFLQREPWNGDPERLLDGFTLKKTERALTISATCEVRTHQFGWELRLVIDGQGVRRLSIARSATEMLKTLVTWYATMLADGWS